MCWPGDDQGRVQFGVPTVRVLEGSAITVTSIELVDPSSLTLTGTDVRVVGTDDYILGATWDDAVGSIRELALPADRDVQLRVGVQLAPGATAGSAAGVKVNWTAGAFTRGSFTTCLAYVVAAAKCQEPGAQAEFDRVTELLSQRC